MKRIADKNLLLLASFALLLGVSSCGSASRYVRRAEVQVDKGNLREAKNYYQKALKKNPDHYRANLGLGIMYTEWLENYTGATPLLENAYAHSRRDTSYDLLFALGKCYHHNSEYDKALSFYARLNNVVDEEGEIDLQKELQKRRADCEYAKSKQFYPEPEKLYVVNAGRTINTDMPEYVPVLTPRQEMIFTSKRKDDKREQLNHEDGKYYESMYIASITPRGFTNLRRYTLPDEVNARFPKSHEAVVSISQDGKHLFTFRHGRIYEADMTKLATEKPHALMNKLGRKTYQNHAFLSADGNTLFFTADMNGGLGGNDIYKATRDEKGEWSAPQNLGDVINTSFDEEAPYLSPDGATFYFSSKGHEGFGNFDIYRSYFIDGKWTKPENLGKPFNSPGHDIFFIYDSLGATGYFASGRNGGFGDMDIYRFLHLDKVPAECTPGADQVVSVTDSISGQFERSVRVSPPANFKALSYEWKVNGESVPVASLSLTRDFRDYGSHVISGKIGFQCDTCFSPQYVCFERNFNFERPVATPTSPPAIFDLAEHTGPLDEGMMRTIGFDLTPITFDFNSSELNDGARTVLSNNAAVMKKFPQLVLTITGHSDSRGAEDKNKRVSVRRAKSAEKYLQSLGIERSRIRTEGRGASGLLNTCGEGVACEEEQHRRNRRVEFSAEKR